MEMVGEHRRFKVVGYHAPFNFSTKINLGVAHATGEQLLLLNDDIEVVDPSWIDGMLAFTENPEIGAVGPRLRFEDGRLQHTGVVLANGHAGHSFYGYPIDTPGYFGVPHVVTNQSAVTAACMLTRRDAFEEVGGLASRFAVNYNDVDYCLRLRDTWVPDRPHPGAGAVALRVVVPRVPAPGSARDRAHEGAVERRAVERPVLQPAVHARRRLPAAGDHRRARDRRPAARLPRLGETLDPRPRTGAQLAELTTAHALGQDLRVAPEPQLPVSTVSPGGTGA